MVSMPELGLLRGAAVILWLLISQTQSICRVHARCVASERDALLSFKASLLDPAGRLSSWQGDDCCHWKGVRCSNRTGNVVTLNLRNSNCPYDFQYTGLSLLGGEMSSSLTDLQNLRHLDLNCNYFNGRSMPVSIASLKNLRYLNLSLSGFSGRIPSQLGILSSLQYLDVSWNYFFHEQNMSYLSSTNLSWLPRLTLLRHLDMTSVDLSFVRNWVHVVNMLPALRVLCLSLCNLNRTVSKLSHSNLTNLEVLDLSDNPFYTSLQQNWFWDLTTLKELNLLFCGWYGSIPDQLGNLTSLQFIDLEGNQLVGLIPRTLERLCDLQVLRLGFNNINASISQLMERLPRCSRNTFQELSLGATNLTGKLPTWIGNMSSLSILSAPSNMITGPLPVRVGTLGNLTNLDLSYNQLNGVLSKDHFAGLLKLEYLDLSYNSLKFAIEPNWVPPFRLNVACFRSCQLGPKFPQWLRWQTDIDILAIENTKLDDVIPDWFWVTFSRASFLQASRNRLRSSLPAKLKHISADHIYLGSNLLTGQVPQLPMNISHLNLSSNLLSGPLPPDLKAPVLEELLLANNQITGSIPPSMCQLIGLKRLDLSGNKITGNLEQMQCWKESDNTSTMTNINSGDKFGSNMLSLALNHNEFSGEFPQFLQSASQLLFLDLSYNRFSGSLPKWLPEIMQQLQILRLRSNNFSGYIPKKLTHLDRLHYLDIAKNNISGTIPEDLARLKAMTVVAQNFESYIFEESIPVITKDQQRDYLIQ